MVNLFQKTENTTFYRYDHGTTFPHFLYFNNIFISCLIYLFRVVVLVCFFVFSTYDTDVAPDFITYNLITLI